MIATRLRQFFTPLSSPERADYAVLLYTAATLPIAWRLSMWGVVAFLLTSFAQLCSSRRLGWHSTTKGQRVVMGLMLLFFVIYFISGSLSTDQHYGWNTTGRKLPFVAFPLAFVLADKRYLSGRHLRLIFYLLWASVSLRFGYDGLRALIHWLQGAPLNTLIGESFSQLHHTYYALYAITGAAFIYSELMRRIDQYHWDSRCWWLLLALIPPFTTVVISNSRTGIICAALLVAIGAIDYLVSQRRWKQMLIGLGIILAVVLVLFRIMPKEYNRFGLELQALRSGQESTRMIMLRSAVETASKSPIWGYGSGDYEAPLQQQYVNNGYSDGLDKHQGSHNQYLETMLECGIFGTLTLIAMLVAPVITSLRRKKGRRLVCSVVMVIAVSIFFESMLGRQMGIIFFCFVLSMLPMACRNPQED